MNEGLVNRSPIRFRKMEELQNYLESVGDGKLDFRAYPISGAPENFHYNGHKKTVTREQDGTTFDNVEDFLCYAFQCDLEGYTHTEHVDIKPIN